MALRSEVPSLLDIDLKSAELNPWTLDQWHSYAYNVGIARFSGTACGFVAYQLGPLQFPGAEDLNLPFDATWIVKLQVKPGYRGLGVGTGLMRHAESFADQKKTSYIFGILPEDACYTGGLSAWLARRGYRCRGIVPRCFLDCGQDVDGLLWEKRLHYANDSKTVPSYVI